MANKEIHTLPDIFSEFSETTTIHGLYYIRRTKLLVKFSWIIVFISMFMYTIWFCQLSINRYLRYDIKTKVTYETQSQRDFPAITFCNQFPIIRSLAGSNTPILTSAVMALTDNITDVSVNLKQSLKTCHVTKSPYDNVTTSDLYNMGLLKMMKLFGQDSFRSVKKCWWAANEFDCNGTFANHFLDRTDCFTFIPDKVVAHLIQYSDYSTLYYGINESIAIDRYVVNSGPNSALQFLMNVNQAEHCDASRKYEGAGFQAVIHDPQNMNPIFSMSSAINLQPGFAISVTLKPTVFRRQTAFLGLCNMSTYLVGEQKIYYKNLCAYFCYVRRIIDICQCVLRVAIPGLDETINSLYGMNVKGIKDCGEKEVICFKIQQYETYLSTNLKQNCPECLQPCFETSYDFLVTAKKLSSTNFVPKDFNITITDMRKNFLMVNFFFDSLSIALVVESQDFTFTDMWIYIGGVIGLFLGMSFMSIGDIFQLLSFTFFAIFTKRGQSSSEFQVAFVESDLDSMNNMRVFVRKRQNIQTEVEFNGPTGTVIDIENAENEMDLEGIEYPICTLQSECSVNKQ